MPRNNQVSRLRKRVKRLKNRVRHLKNLLETANDDLEHELPPPCPKCHLRVGSVGKYGHELNPNARYDAADTFYDVCSNCYYVYSSCY